MKAKVMNRPSTEVAFLLLTQQPRDGFPAFLKTNIDVAEIYRRHWLEESGQRLENINQTPSSTG